MIPRRHSAACPAGHHSQFIRRAAPPSPTSPRTRPAPSSRTASARPSREIDGCGKITAAIYPRNLDRSTRLGARCEYRRTFIREHLPVACPALLPRYCRLLTHLKYSEPDTRSIIKKNRLLSLPARLRPQRPCTRVAARLSRTWPCKEAFWPAGRRLCALPAPA